MKNKMVKFDGFDKNGEVVNVNCLEHKYSEIPMKGLGKSMEGVGIDEPVTVPQSAAADNICWGYTMAEIERRANELGADINWMELKPIPPYCERNFQFWYTKQNEKK